jgi:hypothetical protein
VGVRVVVRVRVRVRVKTFFCAMNALSPRTRPYTLRETGFTGGVAASAFFWYCRYVDARASFTA